MSFDAFKDRPCPQWYREAGFGIFIHWGIFAVPAFAPRGRAIHDLMRDHYDDMNAYLPYAEWYENAARLPGSATARRHAKTYANKPYAAFRPAFDEAAQKFDANVWADLFKQAGARYVVFVTKHHDGYCLWPTKVESPWRPGWHTKRDFVGELADAVRSRGMRFGLYYSGGLDWTARPEPIANLGDMFAGVPTERAYADYAAAQVRELIARYKPSVLWNDIAWPSKVDVPPLFADYYAAVPDGVVNDRWFAEDAFFNHLRDPKARAEFNAMMKARIASSDGPLDSPPPPHCDFRTVEYGMGAIPKDKKWEACRGLGLAFGYNRMETPSDYLTGTELIALHRDVTTAGGNLLINVGPMADATIPVEQSVPLRAIGQSIAKKG
ncbi:MAG: alpha-L-fucosidase [Alphaproteobacteria bacterium]|nr:alpha-L-fucosidase [Alphaproteobacteria bacterium]